MTLGRELVFAQQLPEPVADLAPLALGLLGEGLLRAAPARIGLHGGDLGGGGAASLLGGRQAPPGAARFFLARAMGLPAHCESTPAAASMVPASSAGSSIGVGVSAPVASTWPRRSP